MVSKYYAVVCGATPGIYTDWPTTERMVKGYPGAIFKSFRTKSEAETFMTKSTAVTTTMETPAPHVLPLTNRTIIYTDGSFDKGLSEPRFGLDTEAANTDPTSGFGVVIITSTGDKLTAYGKVPESVTLGSPTNNVAELYAIYVALSLVKGNVTLYTDSRYSIAALTTHVHDWIQNGWKGVANRNLIEGTYSLMQNRDVTLQYVKAHEGFELNEEADSLAKQGRTQLEPLIVLKNGVRII